MEGEILNVLPRLALEFPEIPTELVRVCLLYLVSTHTNCSDRLPGISDGLLVSEPYLHLL
jgi:hypothetical protein